MNIKWENIEVLKKQNFSQREQISWELDELDDSQSNVIEEFDLEYKVIKVKDEENYKLLVTLPFSFQSDWRKTECKDWTQYAKERLKSKLEGKYNDLKKRDLEYRIKFNKFKELVYTQDELDNKNYIKWFKEYHHKLLVDEVNKKPVGNIINEMMQIKIALQDFSENGEKFKSEKEDQKKEILKKSKFFKKHLKATCEYCGITMMQINLLSKENRLQTKRQRGYSMEVDQIDSYGFYTDENCVASCYWCNNAKTDEFTVNEFKEIAESIKKIWDKRLEPYNKSVKFPPEKSSIWDEKKEDKNE